MHEYVYFNNQIVRAAAAALPPISAAALYGKGIFTTVAIRRKQPFLWDKHWRRLQNNADKIGLDLSNLTEIEVKNELFEITAKNKCENGRARLTFYDGKSGGIWKFESGKKTALLITTADFRAVSDNFRLTVSPFPVNSKSPLTGVKSCSYLENILAFDEAKNRGFDEAVRLNENGVITAACLANIFWLKDDKLFTPPLETGCLAGTTREFLVENFSCAEIEASLGDLREANAIFLTSAGIGLVQASKFEDIKYKRKFTEITRIFEFNR